MIHLAALIFLFLAADVTNTELNHTRFEVYAVTPTGIYLDVLDLHEGTLAVDSFYTVHSMVDGEWSEVEIVANMGEFDPRKYTPPRIVKAEWSRLINIYWGWLYGELPHGEYLLWISIHNENDTVTDIPILFTVPETPFRPPLAPANSLFPDLIFPDFESRVWHLFEDPVIFRALVTDRNQADGFLPTFVAAVIPSVDGRMGGGQFFIHTPLGATLDADGIPIPFGDISEGEIIEVIHQGMILDTWPGTLTNILQVSIVG